MSARPCQQLPDAQTHASLPWALTSLGEGGADARRPDSAPSSSLHLAGRPSVLVASGHTRSRLGSYLTSHHRSLRISSRFPPGLGRGRVAAGPQTLFGLPRLPRAFTLPAVPPDPPRRSPPRLWLPLSWAGQQARFSKAQLNAVSPKKPSGRPSRPGSVLVPPPTPPQPPASSAALSAFLRLPSFPGDKDSEHTS